MNLAERVKKQTDKILRQQAQGPNAGVVVVVNAGDGTAAVSNPSADLAKHKQSGDHDGRYARVFTDLDDVPSAYTGQAGKALLVNSEEDGLEFGEAGGGGSEYELPQATASILGGVKAKAKTTETAEVAIDGATGKLYVPAAGEAANGIPAGGTTGQVLAKASSDDYDAEWINAPSGGGYANPIDAPPAIPHVLDDEFDSGTLDAKWSWVNQGSATATIDNGALIIDAPTGKDETRGIIQTAPVGNFVMTAKVSLEAVIGKYYAFGIGLFNSANNRLLQIGRRNASGYVGLWVNKGTLTAFSAETLFSGYGGGYVYLKIEVSGTNIILSYSHTGKMWITILTEAITTYVGAITGIGLMAFRNNTTATNKHFGVCEWFRVVEND